MSFCHSLSLCFSFLSALIYVVVKKQMFNILGLIFSLVKKKFKICYPQNFFS